MITLAALHIYPLKSCGGITLQRAALTVTGLAWDRQWMLVDSRGRFVTQRELPRMTLITPRLQPPGMVLTAPEMSPVNVLGLDTSRPVEVSIWRDRCAAYDEGDESAAWLSEFLHKAVRLVRFDPRQQRLSQRNWTGPVEASNQFSDGFPLLAIAVASLDDLNQRLSTPLPMNRFRPNLVLTGLPPYGEDQLAALTAGDICLHVVKPCTRCVITTTEQTTGMTTGPEPLRTLKSYRWDASLRGVIFGQNMVIAAGVGCEIYVGQAFTAQLK